MAQKPTNRSEPEVNGDADWASQRAGASKGAKPKPEKGSKAKRELTADEELRQLSEQLHAVRAIGGALSKTVGLDALFEQIVPQVSRLMHAQRTTLFLYDASADEIWSKVAEGEGMREIRLKRGQGIAGWVAEHKSSVNIPDAYDDNRFNAEVDARTGFRTTSVAGVPLIDKQGQLVGILQVLNRDDGAFSEEDMGLLEAIAAQTVYAVENARLAQRILDQNKELDAARQRAERRRAELDLLYQLEQETTASADLDQLLDSIVVRTCERLRSEAGSVLILDRDTGKLYFRGVEGPQKDELRRVILEPGEGVVGWVARHGEPVIVNRPEDDPRHERAIAEKISYPAKAILAVPLVWDQKVIGAVEVLNPRPRPTGAIGYDLEDLKVLTVIAGQVARAVTLTLERQARIDTERLALMGRMLASVAHDLRNPMTVISGYAQLMAGEPGEQERQVRCDRILNQIDEMTGMIQDLLAFARGDTRLRPGEVQVEKMAREIDDNLSLQCKPRGIELTITSRPGRVVVDPGRAKRIVYNLARNAVEVVQKGDKLTIDLAAEPEGLYIKVTDTGPGLPEEMSLRIFEPFASHGKAHGTGLGLSIVKRFVDDHRGQISVESAPGKGTSFTVRLPNAGVEPARPTGGEAR